MKLTFKAHEGLCADAMDIRKAVFVEEQGFHDEFDDIDRRSTHLVAFLGKLAVATCRYFSNLNDQEEYFVGRVAVSKPFRGRGIGILLLAKAERGIIEKGGKRSRLAAQLQARKFYEKHGYYPVGDVFIQAGCLHIWMEKKLV